MRRAVLPPRVAHHGAALRREALGASQQNVSKHLGVLLQAGMVSRTKQGTSARYAITDPDVFTLCEQVCGGIRRQAVELDAILQGTVSE